MERIANADEIEITRDMTEAGVEVADLLGFEWGLDCEETLVRRVYRAMDAVRQGSPLTPVRNEAKSLRVQHS